MAQLAPPDSRSESAPPAVSHSDGIPITFDLKSLMSFNPEQVSIEPIEPVDRDFARFGARCIALRNVLTEEECQFLISAMSGEGKMEAVTYRHDYRQNDRCVFESEELAEILWQRVALVAKDLSVFSDPQEPEHQRLLGEVRAVGADGESSICPDELRVGMFNEGVWRPIGLNECLRFCRYNPGGFFRPHCDACFKRSDEEMSLYTCMFYLDGGMSGGATRFLNINGTLTVDNYLKLAAEDQVLASLQPEPGLCLLFFQPGLLHEGEDLMEGSKHILRTDVMFRRDAGTGPQRTPQEEEAWKLVQEAQAAEAASECDRACQLYRRAFKMDPRLERML